MATYMEVCQEYGFISGRAWATQGGAWNEALLSTALAASRVPVDVVPFAFLLDTGSGDSSMRNGIFEFLNERSSSEAKTEIAC
jgi:hypothetical protein